MFGDVDLPVFFADFGVLVTFGSNTVKGIFNRPVQIKLADQGFGGVETSFPSVELPYNAFDPMPDSRDAINVNGTDYTVSAPTAVSDGAVICYDLKAVAL
jgi:hypothetical protein